MKGTFLMTLAAALISCAALAQETAKPAGPFLSPIFTDNLVLQRGTPIPVWGWAKPGERVTVQFEGKTATGVADNTGKWLVKLPSHAAGGPYTLSITGSEKVTLKNVLVGDVWICSGQSNMEMGINNVMNAQEEVANANYPQIRIITVQKKVSNSPLNTFSGQWETCTPQTISRNGWGGFTAAGYFFGRDLHKELKVPIGLIHSSWGGTIAEAWVSPEGLSAFQEFQPAIAQLKASAENQDKRELSVRIADWFQKNDPGTSSKPGWEDPATDISDWKTMKLPTAWEDAGMPNLDGVVWFRLDVDVPEAGNGKKAVLHLGPIDDADITWINGVKVGSTSIYNADRVYQIPEGVLKAGKNSIVVRVLDTAGLGGINGKPDQLHLDIEDQQPISLAGDWKYQVAADLSKTPAYPADTTNEPNIPTVLSNGMIAPLVPYAIKGAIWYQGESNVGRAAQYEKLLPALIKDWRGRFGVGNFPFFIVQLANFQALQTQPGDDGWAELREAQAMTAKTVPNTGLALAIDIGEANDIHPRNKQEVGRRLALAALHTAYGKKLVYSGPAYTAMLRKGNAIEIHFTHAEGGLTTKNGEKLIGFAIAGADHKYVWADAKIVGSKIVVSSPAITEPVAVRYGWGSNPLGNLYNKEGLPAIPFRTDSPYGPTSNPR